jgi:type 1 glutamine amidotransferase
MKTLKLVSSLVLAGLVAAPALAAPKHVLVVTTTTGFRHSSIETAERVIGELGKQSGAFTVEYARLDNNDPKYKGADGKEDKEKTTAAIKEVLAEKMSRAALAKYDAVIFASTTGDLPLPDREALLDFVKSGKGFVGIHSATDTFPGFPDYIDMIGGQFLRHGAQVEVDVINQDKTCAACRHLPDSWKVFDEIYQLKKFDRAKVQGLLTLDKHPNDKTPGDYPIAWKKAYGSGRVIYTSLGHREDIWDPTWQDAKGERKNSPEVAKAYQQHVLGAIKWALGLETGDGPSPKAIR